MLTAAKGFDFRDEKGAIIEVSSSYNNPFDIASIYPSCLAFASCLHNMISVFVV